MKHPIHVTSEIGELQTVLLKRPGKEVENLTPDYLRNYYLTIFHTYQLFKRA